MKTQSIFGLFVFIFIVLLVGLIFETNVEGYKNLPPIGRGSGIGGVGYDINNTYVKPKNSDKIGNMRYPGKKFLNIANKNDEFYYDIVDNDDPLSFDISFM